MVSSSLELGELMLIWFDQCLSADEGQSDGVFMRALPQSVPIMCGTEVAHSNASREHRGDHFEGRLEILCLAARSPGSGKGPGSEFSRALAVCLDPEAGRRILAKDLARPDIAPQSRHRLVTRLLHDDELAHAVHRRLGHASGAERMPAERINIHSGPGCSSLQELSN